MVRSQVLGDWAVFWCFGTFLTMCFNPVERSHLVSDTSYAAVLTNSNSNVGEMPFQ